MTPDDLKRIRARYEQYHALTDVVADLPLTMAREGVSTDEAAHELAADVGTLLDEYDRLDATIRYLLGVLEFVTPNPQNRYLEGVKAILLAAADGGLHKDVAMWRVLNTRQRWDKDDAAQIADESEGDDDKHESP